MFILNSIDITLSYTNSANHEAMDISKYASQFCTFFNYRDWLDHQAGSSIKDVAQYLYCQFPCIILVTRDWYEREATVFEAKCLKINPEPKLVFDFEGSFVERRNQHQIANFSLGEFTVDGSIRLGCIDNWLQTTFPNSILL